MSIKNNTTSLQEVLEILNTKASGGEQATPEISVNSSGLITATAGVKSSTYQLAFQAAKTITPSTISQVAVSSGYYTGGNITVAGDSNLVASNIKSGVSIFGVDGTLEEGNMEGVKVEYSENEDAILSGTISNYTNDRITTIRAGAFAGNLQLVSVSFPECTTIESLKPPGTAPALGAFQYCSSLTTVLFPVCTNIGGAAFSNCFGLTTVLFPVCTRIGSYAFFNCSNLTTVSFPACTSIGSSAFYSCSSLTTVLFPVCTSIGSYVFGKCRTLSSLTLGASSICTLANSNTFSSTPFAGYSSYFSGTPHIYVPSSLITAYQSATNWTYFSSYFSTIESLGSGDNGESGGESDSTIITFTIGGVEYQAEEGMTWGEWVESGYNSDNYYADSNIYSSSGLAYIDGVTSDDTIISTNYILTTSGEGPGLEPPP